MTVESAIEIFTQQPPQEKASLLVRLSVQLTIAARGTYAIGSENVDDPVRLRTLNEIQHRITGYHAALISGTPRYPDDVFVRMILEGDSEVGQVFETLLAEVMNKFAPVTHAKLLTASVG